ncbi:MAG: FimV/HubP family polar landmark protein [Casimicrobiaceae bacterium]
MDSLSARLADQRTYAQNKIDFGGVLSRVRVGLERRGDRPILKISSSQPINEPFLDLLIELNWNTGRLLREYTFLLDPPGFATTTAVDPVPAIPAQSVAPATPASAPRAATPAPAPAPRAASPAETVAAAPATARAKASSDTYGPIKRGETLSKIAAQVKPDGVTLEQMLAALYRANADAFDGKNMNRLRAGRVLSVPKGEDVTSIPRTDAVKEIRVQAADWRGYRDRLAGAAPTGGTEGVRNVTGAEITMANGDRTAPAATGDRLRLSKGDVGAAGAAGGAARAENIAAAQKAMSDANSRVVDLEKQVKDLQRLLELKNSSLLAQQAAAEQARAAGKTGGASAPATMAPAAVSPASTSSSAASTGTTSSAPRAPTQTISPAPASTPTATPASTASTPAATTPSVSADADAMKSAADAARAAALADAAKIEAARAEKAKSNPKAADAASKAAAVPAMAAVTPNSAPKNILRPPATPQEPSFFDEMLGNPTYLVLGGAALGLGLVAWMLSRRRRTATTKFEDSIGAGTDIRTSTVFGNTGGGVVNTGDNSLVSDFSREGLGNIDTGEVDPIAEAEVYLAYGRDNQAEEILKDALGKTPDRQEIRLKLLEIYAQQNKPGAFEATAAEVHAATRGTGEIWAKAAQLGRGIDPANVLYADKGELMDGEPTAPLADLGGPDSRSRVAAAVEKTAAETNFDIPVPTKEVFVMPPALTLPDTHSPAMHSAQGPATLSAPLAAAAAASVAAAAAPQASAMHERAPLDFKLDTPPEVAGQSSPAMDFVTLDGPITLTGATTLSGPSTLAGVTLASPSVDIWGEKPSLHAGEKFEIMPGAPGDRPPDLKPTDITKPAVAAAVAAGVASLSGFSPLTTSTVTRAPQPSGRLELDKLDLAFDPSRQTFEDPTPSLLDGQWHDAATKLDLAKAYQEMGDVDGAREILQEVMQEGDEAQKQEAQTFLAKLRA